MEASAKLAVHPKATRGRLGHDSRFVDVDDFLQRFGNQLLATARRHSANAADADDAYQRALETLVANPPDIADPEGLAAWMHTVVRNEALQTHRQKRHELNTAFDEMSESWLGAAPPAEERSIESDELRRGREALSRINPDQTRCLLLRADGLGYPEICETTGFSYAKVNRLLSEGRKAARLQVGMIESGAECQRAFPTLSMIADGEATAEMRAEVQPHLANCLVCRSTLREMSSAPQELAAVMPLGLAFAADRTHLAGRLVDHLQSAVNAVYERLFGHFAALPQSAEIATGKKLVAVSAVAAALAGGGVALEGAVDAQRAGSPELSPSLIEDGRFVDLDLERGESADPSAVADSSRDARPATAADVARAAEESDSPISGGRGIEGGDNDEVSGDPNELPPASAPVDEAPVVGGLTP